MTGTSTMLRQGFIVFMLLLVSACGGGGGGTPPPDDNPPPTGGNDDPPAGDNPTGNGPGDDDSQENKPPVAFVLPPETGSIVVGREIIISAAESADPDGKIASYAWTQIDGPSVEMTDPTAIELVFTAPAVEADSAIVLGLAVTDDDGATDSLEFPLQLHAAIENNQNPTADAGPDAKFSASGNAMLDGAGSTDTDGQVVAWAWTQLSGPEVTLEGADTAFPSFLTPDVKEETKLAFRLVVTDDRGTTHSDTVIATLMPNTGGNRAPFIGAVDGVPAIPVPEGGNVAFTALGSDPDEDELTYSWELVDPAGITFTGAEFPVTGAELALDLPDVTENTSVKLRVTVSDGSLSASRDVEFVIGFDNQPPTVGVTATPSDLAQNGINEGDSFTLTAEGSDPDGKPGFTFAWTQTAGSVDLGELLAGVTGPELSMPAPDVTTDEVYSFKVTATDADGASVTSGNIAFTVKFVNQAPIANAGPDKSGNEGTEVQLVGENSFDPDDPGGQQLTYVWTQTAGQHASVISGGDNLTIRLPIISGAEAHLAFKLTVVDHLGVFSEADTVNVTVININHAPVIEGITGPASVPEGGTATLTADATDPDNDDLGYEWILPPGFTANGTSGSTLEITSMPNILADENGASFGITLRVTDNGVPEPASAEAVHTLALTFVNQAPVIDSITATPTSVVPGETITLQTTVNDPDGQDLTYSWEQVANGAPNAVSITPTPDGGATVTAPALQSIEGATLQFRVTANDGSGSANATDTGTVNVNLVFENTAPVINEIAADPASVDESGEFILVADVTDPDLALGQELTYAWAQAAGETPVIDDMTINPDGTATVTAPNVDADTVLHFAVTVNDGVTSVTSDLLPVTVKNRLTMADPFTFTDLTHAAPGLTHSSNEITISGLGDGLAVPLAISGGEYSLNGGAFTTDVAGVTVNNGDRITLRGDAPGTGGESAAVTLTIGDETPVSETFGITAADSELALSTSFKAIHVQWSEMQGVDTFKVEYRPGAGEEFTTIADNLAGTETGLVDNGLYYAMLSDSEPEGIPVHQVDWEPTYDQYRLLACNEHSPCEVVSGHVARLEQEDSISAIGYFKADVYANQFAQLGWSVAVSRSGDTIVAGIPRIDNHQGGIAIYRKVQDQWSLEVESDDSPYGNQNARFGEAVDVSDEGNVVVAGAAANLINGAYGDVVVYVRDDASGTWSIASLEGNMPSLPQDASRGEDVAVSGDGEVLAIGIPGDNDGGSVWIFRKTAENAWTYNHKISRPAGSTSVRFGQNVDLDQNGNTLVVGMGNIEREAHVFSFNASAEEWSYDAMLDAGLGSRISINDVGDRVLAGTRLYRDVPFSGWLEVSGFEDQVEALGILSGVLDVAISGDGSLAVLTVDDDSLIASGIFSQAAPGGDIGSEVGGAYLLVRTSFLQWQFRRYIKARNAGDGDTLGYGAALDDDGGTLVIGAPREDGSGQGINPPQDDVSLSTGAIYVY